MPPVRERHCRLAAGRSGKNIDGSGGIIPNKRDGAAVDIQRWWGPAKSHAAGGGGRLVRMLVPPAVSTLTVKTWEGSPDRVSRNPD